MAKGTCQSWDKIRAFILERDHNQCWYCKITQAELAELYGRITRLLLVHHIKPRHFFAPSDDKVDEGSNLVTLCHKCHYKAGIVGSDVYVKLKRKRSLILTVRGKAAVIGAVF